MASDGADYAMLMKDEFIQLNPEKTHGVHGVDSTALRSVIIFPEEETHAIVARLSEAGLTTLGHAGTGSLAAIAVATVDEVLLRQILAGNP